MIEILVLVGVVLVGWFVIQMMRSRQATPTPSPSPASPPPPLPGRLAADPARLGAGARIRITHTVLRQAASRAARQGNRFVIAEFEEVYFVLDAIDDEDERRRVHDVLTRAQDGNEDVDTQELLSVARRISQG